MAEEWRLQEVRETARTEKPCELVWCIAGRREWRGVDLMQQEPRSLTGGWTDERILIVVKTYPEPSRKSVESVCTAGIIQGKGFVRLFPVPFRLLSDNQRFARYTWVDVPIKKASDWRPESHTPDLDKLVCGERMGSDRNWEERRRLLAPLISPSIEYLQSQQRQTNVSLWFIKPKEIIDFYLKPCARNWTEKQIAALCAQDMFERSGPRRLLEKIPFEFHYKFRCDDPTCNGHDMQCLDWEVSESYRSWRRKYPEPSVFKEKFLARFREEMIKKNDTHFYVGTLIAHPLTWTIVGLFYPKKAAS